MHIAILFSFHCPAFYGVLYTQFQFFPYIHYGAGAHSEACPTSKMERFEKIVNAFNIF